MGEMRLGLVIPTKDRPNSLRRLLESIAQQSVLPEQLIVVDGSASPVEPLLAAFPILPSRYVRVQPPSLTRQKNVGIAALDSSISHVGFLDDDLMLEKGALEAMRVFWQQVPPQVGGAGLTLLPPDPARGLWVKEFFLLDDRESGRLLRSGYNTALRPSPTVYATQWLRGGASVWRREVVEAFRFDEWFSGYSYLEDVDYSLRVGREYTLMMVPGARAWHEDGPTTWRGQFQWGVWQVTNRLHLVRKHPEFSAPWCAWSLVGQFLLNATVGLVHQGGGGPLRVLGNLAGVVNVAVGLGRWNGCCSRS